MSELLTYIINALGPIVTFFFVARFLLQATRADRYNPISQGVVAVTDPILKPLRMIIPIMGRWDIAALVGAWLLELLFLYALYSISADYYPGTLQMVVYALFEVLGMILTVIWALILITIVISLLAAFGGMQVQHPLINLMNQVIEPIMAPARSLIPPIGGMDLSPILVILIINILNDVMLPQIRGAVMSAL